MPQPSLNDILAANSLLISVGGEDQLPKLAATAIERSLILQERVARALEYAQAQPANSTHARNMARILDGSITLEDVAADRAAESAQKALSTGAGRKPGPMKGRKLTPEQKAARKPWGSNRVASQQEASR